jgi:uncharacterized protein YlxW (UPF0749 family)
MWTAFVLIVLIGAIARVWQSRKHSSAEIARKAEQLPSQREKQLEGEVTDLRERIQVLERIATDSNSTEAVEARRIAEEIEELREAEK